MNFLNVHYIEVWTLCTHSSIAVKPWNSAGNHFLEDLSSLLSHSSQCLIIQDWTLWWHSFQEQGTMAMCHSVLINLVKDFRDVSSIAVLVWNKLMVMFQIFLHHSRTSLLGIHLAKSTWQLGDKVVSQWIPGITLQRMWKWCQQIPVAAPQVTPSDTIPRGKKKAILL
jgi:hypothetical protein